MYRILSAQKLNQVKHRVLSSPLKTASQNVRHGSCCLRNQCILPQSDNVPRLSQSVLQLQGLFGFLNFPVRSLTTDTSPIRKRKVKKQRSKKFTELLQVTNEAKETVTAVKRLKAANLKNFISSESPKSAATKTSDTVQMEVIDFRQLFQNQEVSENDPLIFVDTKQKMLNFSVIDWKEILESHKALNEAMQEVEEKEALEEEAVPVETKSANYRTFSDKHRHSDKSLKKNLRSYLEMVVATGSCEMMNRGLSIIMKYRYKAKKEPSKGTIIDIDILNVLIEGYAGNGNWTKVRDILKIIKEDGIQMTPQTFSGILECLGRIEMTPKVKEDMERYIKKAEKQGISTNDIMDRSKFVGDQRDMVLGVIQIVDPTFVPVYTPPSLGYSNELLNHLNRNVKPITPTFQVKSSERSAGYLEKARAQLDIEMKGILKVKSINKFSEPTPKVLHYRKKLEEIYQLWYSQICAAFNRDFKSVCNQASSNNFRSMNLVPYLKVLPVRHYAEILLMHARMLTEGSESYSPTLSTLYRDLGQKVQTKFQIERKIKNGVIEKTGDVYAEYCEFIGSTVETGDNARQAWQRLSYHNQEGPSLDIVEKPWPISAQVGVGRFLYNILKNDLKIDTNATKMNAKKSHLMPAFYDIFRYHGKLVREEIKPHPTLITLYRGSQQEDLLFDANLVPMICPCRPWIDEHNGGYLLSKSDFIRLPSQAVQQMERIENSPTQNLYPAIDTLNQLSNVPWKINNELLDIVVEVFNSGGNEKLDIPTHPSALPYPSELLKDKSKMSGEEKSKMFRMKYMHKRRQDEQYSLWCDTLYRLSLANHFREKVFWLPHNMDFRGRVYPIPPHLSHMGSDLARSLMTFHEAKPLGVDGFSWLKLHCINLTGLKKRESVQDRLLYAEDIMEDILDSAERPLTGRMWWTKSEEPWQTLATCIEIAKVTKSGCPERYMCSLPIHQDGSCNGLQHYAAMGRDTIGAKSVSLSPSERPQDVYSDVAAIVEKLRKKDAENGVPIAVMLEGFVRRKVIKQTVMTTVYGVTRYGARLQIAKQLKDIEDFPQEYVWQASSYLSTKVFESLREMFSSAKEIQDWLTECARQISGVRSKNVEWVTPLGLPVTQPYTRYDKRVKGVLTETTQMDLYEKPNTMKQKNAFAPNFVHSLDSSHMMLTSLHCERAGITYVSVHDCFWTHACTVPEMNKICRDQFIALHSTPILENLAQFFSSSFSYQNKELAQDGSVTDMARSKLNKTFQQVPKKGDFDLNEIRKSVYFFS